MPGFNAAASRLTRRFSRQGAKSAKRLRFNGAASGGVPYRPGLYAWELANVRRIPPSPCPAGRACGTWNCPDGQR